MVIIYGVIGLGSLLMFIAFMTLTRSLLLSLTGHRTEGVVVRLVEDAEDHLFAPVVQFVAYGQTIEFQHHIYQNPPYQIGQTVKIIYNSRNPYKAKIRTFSSLYILPLILGVLGLGMAGVGVFLTTLN